jgi:thiol:disulfide interchange protein
MTVRICALAALFIAPLATSPIAAQATVVDAPAPAQALVDAAVRRAATEHKAVLVKFGASWCGWCHRFDAFLADTDVGPIMAANFVTVALVTEETPANKTRENPGSEALMTSMGGASGGLPFFFILDSTGKKIGDSNVMPDGSNVGHPDKPEEVAAFDQLLQRTAPRITARERARIRTYFDRIAGRTVTVTHTDGNR